MMIRDFSTDWDVFRDTNIVYIFFPIVDNDY